LARHDFYHQLTLCNECGSEYEITKNHTIIIIGDYKSKPDFIIFGDSHTDMWRTGLDNIAKYYGIKGLAIFSGGCVPVQGLEHILDKRCHSFIENTFEYIDQSKIKNIILAGAWSSYIERLNIKVEKNPHDIFSKNLEQVFEKINKQHKKIYFMIDVPKISYEKNYTLKHILAKTIANGKNENHYFAIDPDRAELDFKLEKIVYQLQKKHNITILDPRPHMPIRGNEIMIIKDSRTAYIDETHLSPHGSLLFRNTFLPLMQDILAERARPTHEETENATNPSQVTMQ